MSTHKDKKNVSLKIMPTFISSLKKKKNPQRLFEDSFLRTAWNKVKIEAFTAVPLLWKWTETLFLGKNLNLWWLVLLIVRNLGWVIFCSLKLTFSYLEGDDLTIIDIDIDNLHENCLTLSLIPFSTWVFNLSSFVLSNFTSY